MDQKTLLGKPCVPKYDSHFVLVDKRPKSQLPLKPSAPSASDPLGAAQLWTEFCLFESSHLLPLFVLHF